MEETIGYEALLSAEEWGELDFLTDWEEPSDGHHGSTHLCRCSAGNDMICPAAQPL